MVIVGAKFGKGQRKDCYGSFLCAVREESEVLSFTRFKPICSVGSGFTKEQLRQLHEELQPLLTSREELENMGVGIPKAVKMDAFFQPRVVLEVKAASVTRSPLYRGVSLRFPRFVRFRPDKKASDVTSVDAFPYCFC